MCASPCSRAILALQVVGDKPLTSWLVVSLGTKYTQAPTPPQTPAPWAGVRPLESASINYEQVFVCCAGAARLAAARLAASVRL